MDYHHIVLGLLMMFWYHPVFLAVFFTVLDEKQCNQTKAPYKISQVQQAPGYQFNISILTETPLFKAKFIHFTHSYFDYLHLQLRGGTRGIKKLDCTSVIKQDTGAERSCPRLNFSIKHMLKRLVTV